MTINSKGEWRRLLRQRRRCLTHGQRQHQARAMATHLLEQVLPRLDRDALVAGYVALAAEPDLTPHLHGTVALALPAVYQGRLQLRRWSWGEPLEPDDCGVPAPWISAPVVEPDAVAMLLIPAVAMHPDGFRLGYGGGWYDRLLSQPAWAQRPSLGVCFSCCTAVPFAVDPWDRPLHGQLTEKSVQWWRHPWTGGPDDQKFCGER
ncbi:5-formyltetrahydrofolate cyclo-ligase [Candidatus Synechococcus spongiarum]|uniref:5-formyltetrahydrofolate cyclo-ligase n=1 Tax=Candidatus Synechococcus spongiarum TaxID=431041 RepID=A0A164YWY3_9SYNE|nr:5-formyltetrahydrofolate cyclo-ligase [Candidatus Synechococcus spongiarum]SAY38829.1 5-formyltetrahydrofolate cyclo-ligase (EC 6.3.3.2) [Candidatus Synechococcus spongiarum]